LRLAIDFDNTIVSYGDLFSITARSLGYISDEQPRDKTALRDHLRRLPEGEEKWQHVQAVVYGSALTHAVPFAGLREFLRVAKQFGADTFLVSHKTCYAASCRDRERLNLRDAARAWLRRQRLIGCDGFAERDVYFQSTVARKLARIRVLRCTHVVDDLVEVLEADGFPRGAERMLFAPDGRPSTSLRGYTSWDEVRETLFVADFERSRS
jgi:hypothetical protein